MQAFVASLFAYTVAACGALGQRCKAAKLPTHTATDCQVAAKVLPARVTCVTCWMWSCHTHCVILAGLPINGKASHDAPDLDTYSRTTSASAAQPRHKGESSDERKQRKAAVKQAKVVCNAWHQFIAGQLTYCKVNAPRSNQCFIVLCSICASVVCISICHCLC